MPPQVNLNHKPKITLPALAVFLAAVVLAAGCGVKSGGSTLPEIYIGFEGVNVAFARESVPGTVSAGSSYDVVLLITNSGAATSDKAIVSLKDSKKFFAFTPKQIGPDLIYNSPILTVSKPLPGRDTDPAGYLDSVTLTMASKSDVLSVGEEKKDTDLRADVCYSYKTKLTANVCIDASSYSFQKQRKPCDYKAPLVFSKGQGAPVAVKRIETLDPDKSGGFVKPRFKIFIGNVGTGLIIDQDKLNLFCTDKKQVSEDDSPKINVVRVNNIELNGKSLGSGIQCSDTLNGKTETVLDGSVAKDYIICEYQGTDFADGSGTFVPPLLIELSYGYTFTSNPIPIIVEKGIGPSASSTSQPPPTNPRQACGTLGQDCDENSCCSPAYVCGSKGECITAPASQPASAPTAPPQPQNSIVMV